MINKFSNLLLLLIIGCVFQNCSTSETTPDQPNIILLMGDDHGWEETGYNGHAFLQTPVLDEMAASGLRMDNFYSASPVCSPTRGSVITGRHPNRYGTFTPNWSIRPEEISVAQLLNKAGYQSGHFGKWHLGPVKASSPTSPGAMGFETWLSHDNFFEIDPVLSRNGAQPEKIEGESSMILIDETIRFIEKAKSENKPFLAVVWFGSPHEPYQGLPEDLALYENLPDSLSEYQVSLTSIETGRSTRRPLDSVLQERYAEITAMDRAIGKLRSHLSQANLRDNTLLWYCGDNGIPGSGVFNTKLRAQKGAVYEGGIKVPGIIEWPAGIPDPKITKVNSVTSDILPTLCTIAGQSLPNRPIDGINITPVFEGKMEMRSTPICFWDYETSHEMKYESKPYIDPELQEGTTPLVKMMAGKYTRSFRNFHHPEIQQEDYAGPKAITDNQYKLVMHDDKDGAIRKELFDLESDPYEQVNLIDRHPEIAKGLENQIVAWQESVLRSLTGADYQ